MDLSSISTKDLAEELRNREGVGLVYSEAFKTISLEIDRPSYVLIVDNSVLSED
ncbi:MAG: hypothetical protein ACOX7H_03240 [Bacillota bacterium]|jgi:hypothetical protein